MYKKSVHIICICLSGIILLMMSACGNKTENESTTKADLSDLFTDAAMDSTTDTDEALSPMDSVINTTEYPTYAFAWSDDIRKFSEGFPDDDTMEFTYDGEYITFYSQLVAGGYDGGMELGILLYVNGVLQSFIPSVGDTREQETSMYICTLESCEEKIVKLQFKPTIGYKGEKLQLHCCIFNNPDFTVDAADETQGYLFYHDYGVSGPFTINMNTDADQQTQICRDYKYVSVDKPDNLVNEHYKAIPSYGEPVLLSLIKCGDINTCFKKTEDVYDIENRIVAEPEDNFDFCFYGEPGQYRAAFFVNNTLQPVFDGCSYLDISVKKDMQTTVSVPVSDTDIAAGSNHCYLVLYGIDAPEELMFIKTDTHPVLYR